MLKVVAFWFQNSRHLDRSLYNVFSFVTFNLNNLNAKWSNILKTGIRISSSECKLGENGSQVKDAPDYIKHIFEHCKQACKS